jgi:adenosine kinase
LKLLGGDPLPMGTVGNDFGPYATWMDRCGISRRYIKVIEDTYTGQAFITTDMDDNQITAFHPGAMNLSHENHVGDAPDATIGIVAPDGRDGMVQHAAQFAEAGIPFIFDPGQGLPMFDGAELMTFIEQASWVTLNDYEAQLLRERTGHSLEQLAQRVQALVVTLGSQGSRVYTDGGCIEIPPAMARTVSDPTGCGDAYRAGLLFGLARGLEWEMTARIAALMGAIKIEQYGTQNHKFTRADFDERFERAFGSPLPPGA